jgi:hypothetical protein
MLQLIETNINSDMVSLATELALSSQVTYEPNTKHPRLYS